jgi:cysteine-rich repeat protein
MPPDVKAAAQRTLGALALVLASVFAACGPSSPSNRNSVRDARADTKTDGRTDTRTDSGPPVDAASDADVRGADGPVHDAAATPEAGSGGAGGSDAGHEVASETRVPRCGDGTPDPGEACDDGNRTSGDGCDFNCRPTGCGNNVKTAGEACDDGNLTSGDGCDSNCTPTACGNNVKTAGEACDDGNLTSGDGCDSNCTPTACGNGVKFGAEACDDGNLTSGDGCDSNCTPTACGNNVKTVGEACDDGNLASGDGCDFNCTLPACGNFIQVLPERCDDGNLINGDGCDSNCTPTACGNGVKFGAEACDDGNLSNGDGCDSNCKLTACGNGIKFGAEACDDGNLVSGDGCDSNCTPTACGNGVVTSDERCDDGNRVEGDGCDSNCRLTACGNGVRSAGEECDDGNVRDGDGCTSKCVETQCGDGVRELGELCYGPAVGSNVGDGPLTVAAGDFDEDGLPDLAVAVRGAGAVSIHKGQGDGYLRSTGSYPMPQAARVVTADLDGDGHLDLVVGAHSDRLRVMWGDGRGAFPTSVEMTVVTYLMGVATGDFDGDHVLDVIVTSTSQDAAVLFGAGGRTFSTPSMLQLHPPMTAFIVGVPVVADFDGDGFDDFAFPNMGTFGSGSTLWRSAGKGRTFLAPTFAEYPSTVQAIAVGDFNEDRIPDLVTSSGPDFGLNVGLGGGKFRSFVETRVANFERGLNGEADAIAVADFDGDGHQDVAVALVKTFVEDEYKGYGDDEIVIAYGAGDGTFPLVRWFDGPAWPSALEIADFDRDGRPDIAAPGYVSGTVGVLRGTGTSFETPSRALFGSPNGPARPYHVDFDHDGVKDIVGRAVHIAWLRGKADGTFWPKANLTTKDDVGSGFAATREGWLTFEWSLYYASLWTDPMGVMQRYDLITTDLRDARYFPIERAETGEQQIVYLVGAKLAFTHGGGGIALPGTGTDIASGDFDGDGRNDLVVGTTVGPCYIKRAPNVGWEQPVAFDPTPGAGGGSWVDHTVAVGDFNDDGLDDVAVGHGTVVNVYLGDKAQFLVVRSRNAVRWTAWQMATTDFDGDGKLDLVAAGNYGIAAFLGRGDGTLRDQYILSSGTPGNRTLLTADLNRDGAPDFVTLGAGGDLVFFRSDP